MFSISNIKTTTWCAAITGCMASVAIKGGERADTGVFMFEDDDCF